MSVATLIAFIAIAWEFAMQRRLALASAPTVAFASDGPEAEATTRGEPGQGAHSKGRRRHRRK
jgi:hypothetical protein